jgi:hypothetical protein
MRRNSAGMSSHGEGRAIKRNKMIAEVKHDQSLGKELGRARAEPWVQPMFTRSTAHEAAARSLFATGRR